MNQLTRSGFDRELADRIRHLANQEGLSLMNHALKGFEQISTTPPLASNNLTSITHQEELLQWH